MIESLLIANRGEIACRIIRTAREMGIRTVAIYSDADASALHVRAADEAVHIGPSPARESYLVGDRIIAAAMETGAQAIHPGYGFLSENAAFAQAVIDAGLIWVGPKPASIDAMGLKDAAKALMQAAGVPVTPGYMGENQDPAFLAAEAARIGYPVLIKAVAGGGGKGMRRVDDPADFADALASCQREAAASFGNDHVLIEKYILSPRHIEVQVFGDSHGNVVHLFERDCSLQRRHQKVIEEAPAPGMDEATREAICMAAVRAAKAVDYEGAGTIEFIADGSNGLRADRIWFMEMNTRLQVEHPVTEEITGVDLVEWQLRVASGEPLPLRQDELGIDGCAVEARLYAEDTAKGFLPSTGTLDIMRLNDDHARIDTGVREQDTISPFYDPMIAKVICTGATRGAALDALDRTLRRSQVWPVRTNKGFLVRLLADPEFRAGTMTTGLIAARGDDLLASPVANAGALKLATSALRHLADPDDTFGGYLFNFRLNRESAQPITVAVDGSPVRFTPQSGGANTPWVQETDDGVLMIVDGDDQLAAPVAIYGSGKAGASDGAILSPMPGKVIAVEVIRGQTVIKGQKLLTLEAMKMEHTLTAPFDGTVDELPVTAGAQVQVEALLARIAPAG